MGMLRLINFHSIPYQKTNIRAINGDGKFKVKFLEGYCFGFWSMHIDDSLYQKRLHGSLIEKKPKVMK